MTLARSKSSLYAAFYAKAWPKAPLLDPSWSEMPPMPLLLSLDFWDRACAAKFLNWFLVGKMFFPVDELL